VFVHIVVVVVGDVLTHGCVVDDSVDVLSSCGDEVLTLLVTLFVDNVGDG
jgi:hypothetical protein